MKTKTFILTFFTLLLFTAISNAMLFADLPFSAQINVFNETSELTEKDFNNYLKMPEDIATLRNADLNQAKKYIADKYGITPERYIYTGIKISYIYNIIYSSEIKDEESRILVFNLLDKSINPSKEEIALLEKYKPLLNTTLNKLQTTIEK